MKIAVASEGNMVSGHFGHCEGFNVYIINNCKVIESEFIENPGHRPGYLPKFLKELDVDTIIAGGMGETAQELFRENRIEVVVGAIGASDEVIQKFLGGQLKSTGSVCREHQHGEECKK